MGVAVSTVFKVIKEYKSIGKVKTPPKMISNSKTIINDTEVWVKCAIRRKVHRFYFNNGIPIVKKILVCVPNNKKSIFYELIKHIGFKYKRQINSHLLDRKYIVL